MNTKKSHKIFSLIMLILIISSIVATASVAIYNIYDYKHQQTLREEALSAISAASSDVASEK